MVVSRHRMKRRALKMTIIFICIRRESRSSASAPEAIATMRRRSEKANRKKDPVMRRRAGRRRPASDQLADRVAQEAREHRARGVQRHVVQGCAAAGHEDLVALVGQRVRHAYRHREDRAALQRAADQKPEEDRVFGEVRGLADQRACDEQRCGGRRREHPLEHRDDDPRGVGGGEPGRREGEDHRRPQDYRNPFGELGLPGPTHRECLSTHQMNPCDSRIDAVTEAETIVRREATTHQNIIRAQSGSSRNPMASAPPPGVASDSMQQTHIFQSSRPAPPCTVVIFGASGDLARRKLLPALYNLVHCGQGLMSPKSAVLGFARSPLSSDQFRASSREAVDKDSRPRVDEGCWRGVAEGLHYLSGLDQPYGFRRLRERLEEIERERGIPPNRVYYLSIPPEAFKDCIARLSAEGLISAPSAPHFTRVVVEKPIGRDLESALEISRTLHQHMAESQIFRIDHYLGKETVQNLLVLRFANSIFERLWGSRNVDHVQITVAEAEGVGTRAGYYDHSGALRDMVQNHILQLLTMLTMEAPVTLDAADIGEAKLNVLRALRPIRPEDAADCTVRARYSEGRIGDTEVPGYLDERGIAPDSRTETFVALKVFIDNWRWSGVPFLIRTGKSLKRRAS